VLSKLSDLSKRKLSIKDPMKFMREWLSIRRCDQEFKHTPMGHLCFGKPASHSFLHTEREKEIIKASTSNTNGVVESEDLEDDCEKVDMTIQSVSQRGDQVHL
jgi:hypothetical protein